MGAVETAPGSLAADRLLARRRGLRVRRSRPRARGQPRGPGRRLPRRRGDRRPQRDPAAGGRRAAAAVHARRSASCWSCSSTPARWCSPTSVLPGVISVDSFGDALLAALVMAAVSIVLQVVTGHERRRRVHAARRAADRPPPGRRDPDRCPGHPLPRDRRAGAAGPAPRDARRQRAEHGALGRRGRLPPAEWETDLSSQTGASQAGILLGSNEDIPAFRWVEKETRNGDDLLGAGRLRRDRAPARDGRRPAASTAARAAATCSPARPTRRSSRSAAWRPRRRRTPATGPSSPTASTSPGRWSCSAGRCCSSGRRRSGRPAATCARAGTAAASTRSCAARCA